MCRQSVYIEHWLAPEDLEGVKIVSTVSGRLLRKRQSRELLTKSSFRICTKMCTFLSNSSCESLSGERLRATVCETVCVEAYQPDLLRSYYFKSEIRDLVRRLKPVMCVISKCTYKLTYIVWPGQQATEEVGHQHPRMLQVSTLSST